MTEKLSVSELTENYNAVKKRLSAALQKAGRPENAVTLLAATKTVDPETINRAIELGITHIGENRVQELLSKNGLIKPVHNHFIGHLQTNKARQAVALFDLIESVDSEHLLAAVDKEAARINKVQDILLQLNIAHEEQKSGFARDEYLAVLPKLSQYEHVRVRGLMVIAPKTDDDSVIRAVFAAGYRCFCRLQQQLPEIDCLSMGMSGDYEIAIEEGANIVRVGTALFGQRDYSLKF